MVFKRRDRRPVLQTIADFVYPRGGWSRAYLYVRHRLHRLPDPPHRIARGIFAGIIVCFTPFFGLHFILAALVAKLMRANMLAALLTTFIGNPLTFPVIAAISLSLGHLILGSEADGVLRDTSLTELFLGAARDFKDNFAALFTTGRAVDWSHLSVFYSEVLLPYLIGGAIPGFLIATVSYYLSVPVITAYQNRRRGRLRAKLEELKARKAAKKKADDAGKRG